MFFNKKNTKSEKCERCKSDLNEEFSFCPYCGNALLDAEKERKDFGILGRNDSFTENDFKSEETNVLDTFTDKIIDSMMKSMMKSMSKEIKTSLKPASSTKVTPLPNGISISIGAPAPMQRRNAEKPQRRGVSEEQIKRLTELPRTTAKTNVRRLPDKVVYELLIPGIKSPEDVFVSKLENGYEIKAIGNKKVYVNSLSIDLPIRGFAIDKEKLSVEFKSQ